MAVTDEQGMFPVSRAVTRLRKMERQRGGERRKKETEKNWQRNEEREKESGLKIPS